MNIPLAIAVLGDTYIPPHCAFVFMNPSTVRVHGRRMRPIEAGHHQIGDDHPVAQRTANGIEVAAGSTPTCAISALMFPVSRLRRLSLGLSSNTISSSFTPRQPLFAVLKKPTPPALPPGRC